VSHFVDAHCHLHEPWFSPEMIKSVIENSKKANVKQIVNCASDPSQFEYVLNNYIENSLVVTLGIQPTLADEYGSTNQIEILFNNKIKKNKIKAIGEVGLDYYWIEDPVLRKKQRELFRSAIELANEMNLPLVIHSRKAEGDCLDILEQFSHTSVLLHSFEGNLEQINRATDLGYLISIPTNVVIRKNRRKVAKRAGLENIILETDSPYCAPTQNMFPNTPVSIPIAATKLSQIFETNINEIRTVTTKNAKKFYHLK
jgi:TatD DNase family protein